MWRQQHWLTNCANLAVTAYPYGRGETMAKAVQQIRNLFGQYIIYHEALTRISERTFRIRAVSQNKGKQL